MPRSARETTNFERPYSPGWFDRLTDWIDRMPGPNALYCLGLLVFQFGYLTALRWLNGKLPVGSIDLRLVFMVVVAPYLLWMRFHLDRVAAAALDVFRPVLAVSDAEFLRLRYCCRSRWLRVQEHFSVRVNEGEGANEPTDGITDLASWRSRR